MTPTNLEKLRAGHGLRMPPSDSWGKPARDDYEAALALMRQAADEIEALRESVRRNNADWHRLIDQINAGNGPAEMFRLQDAAKTGKGVEAFIAYIAALWNEADKSRREIEELRRENKEWRELCERMERRRLGAI